MLIPTLYRPHSNEALLISGYINEYYVLLPSSYHGTEPMPLQNAVSPKAKKKLKKKTNKSILADAGMDALAPSVNKVTSAKFTSTSPRKTLKSDLCIESGSSATVSWTKGTGSLGKF